MRNTLRGLMRVHRRRGTFYSPGPASGSCSFFRECGDVFRVSTLYSSMSVKKSLACLAVCALPHCIDTAFQCNQTDVACNPGNLVVQARLFQVLNSQVTDGMSSDPASLPEAEAATLPATSGRVSAFQKISDLEGNLTAVLDDQDNFGGSVAVIGDLDGDGVVDVAVGAPTDDDGGPNRGAVHILFLNSDGTLKAEQKISDTSGALVSPLSNLDFFGFALAGPGDLDGDGIEDLFVGAMQDKDGSPSPIANRGAVYVLFLNADGTVKAEQKISDTQGGLAAALDNGDRFGIAVTAPGDIDGDTVPDMVVGAFFDDDGGMDRGAAYVLFLNTNGTVKAEQKISNTQGGLTAALADGVRFGAALAGPGDLDGDNIPDLFVGSPRDNDGGTERGAVYVLYLNADGTVKGEQKISATSGNLSATLDDQDGFGVSLSAPGELDGDGVRDLVVGAWQDDDGGPERGAAYVLFLNADGTVKAEQKISNSEGDFAAALDDGDSFGKAIAAPGDLNGDEIPDLLISAWTDDDGGPERGAVYVLFLEDAR